MLRFVPLMILTGRLRLNRVFTLLTDGAVSVAFWFCLSGELTWIVPVGLLALFLLVFAVIGYRCYYLPVKTNQVIRVRFSRDDQFVNLSLIIMEGGEEIEYPLAVKMAQGSAYHFYLLSIYIRLADSLTRYARSLKAVHS
ncbi:hypothetical protein [Providencia rettgeri]|uniref:hypothetical protein n=1 Tax=Providencia rettgeri TaxID=587 RepID=UPI00118322DA|nr:hypothetical protein [Providencia rettgeri]